MGTFTNSEDPGEMPHNIMRHFIRVSPVYTVCICKKDLQAEEYNIF